MDVGLRPCPDRPGSRTAQRRLVVTAIPPLGAGGIVLAGLGRIVHPAAALARAGARQPQAVVLGAGAEPVAALRGGGGVHCPCGQALARVADGGSRLRRSSVLPSSFTPATRPPARGGRPRPILASGVIMLGA